MLLTLSNQKSVLFDPLCLLRALPIRPWPRSSARDRREIWHVRSQRNARSKAILHGEQPSQRRIEFFSRDVLCLRCPTLKVPEQNGDAGGISATLDTLRT